MNDPRGSIWRLWDLHYHTPSSYDVNNAITNQGIIEELLCRHISAVAITDHHVIDIERIKELQAIAGTRLAVYPGIELRSELGGSESVHYIGIFAPESDLSHIWTTLQGKMAITPSDVAAKSNDAIYVDFKEGSAIIHKLGGIVSVHAGKKSNSIERIAHATDYQRAVKVELVEKCIDIFEAKDASDAIDYRSIVFPNIGMTRPIIVGSDIHHSVSDTERTPCWIKADTTFAGLKRILVEPERVFLGPEPPSLVYQRTNTTRYCELLTFTKKPDAITEEHWFTGDVPLNSGLVAVIGNKGSGKSALADTLGLVGNTPREKYFSFLNDDKFRRPRDHKAEQFQASLRWLSGDVVVRLLSENVAPSDVETIKYIPQSYLETICNEVVGGKGSEFNKELNSVIFSHVPDDQRLGCNTFDELIEFRTNETHEHIGLLQRNLHVLNEHIVTLNERLTEEHRQVLEQQYRHKQTELTAHVKAKPDEIRRPDIDPAVEDQNTKLAAAIQALRVEADKAELVIAEITAKNKLALRRKALAEKLKAKLENIQRTLNDFAENCSECEELGIKLNEIATFEISLTKVDEIIIESQLASLEMSQKLVDDEDGTPAYVRKQLLNKIVKLRRTMDMPNQRYQQYLEDLAKWEARKKEIEGGVDIAESLVYFKTLIERLNRLPAELEAIKEERGITVRAIYKEIDTLAQIYATLYNPIETTIAIDPLREQGLQIGFKVSIVPEDFEERLFGLIHQGKRGTFCGVEDGQKKLGKMLRESDFSTAQGVEAFVSSIDNALSFDLRYEGRQPVRIMELVKKGIVPVDVYDFVFGLEYLFPRYELTWGDRTLDQLSPGERGALLLVFYLLVDNDTIPLVIDQPEENLDNESVYRMLVPCIKKAKERRQVIIVTHNPNLAVVCDADQIIYCEMDKPGGNRITYTTGAIENPVINHHIVDVLEGTRPAFDLRDAKYKLVET